MHIKRNVDDVLDLGSGKMMKEMQPVFVPPLAPPQRVPEEEPHYCQMRVEVQTHHMVSIDTTG